MSAPGQPNVDVGPDWVVAEMPSGYHNRLAEIQRLTADLSSMGRYGRLLIATGPELAETVRDFFASLQFETALLQDNDTGMTGVSVRLPGRGRLLFHVSGDTDVVQKKSPEMASVFQMLHELADDQDRVVFVTNVDPSKPLSERRESLTPDAAQFLRRMSAGHVASSTLFALWKLSLPEPERAREQVLRLHGHEGGTFELPASVRV